LQHIHEHVKVVEGGIEVSKFISTTLGLHLFTGSIAVGKIIAKAAAEHLTPTTLEFRVKSVHY
jgi:aldehyde dehydrogenase (NAD+)